MIDGVICSPLQQFEDHRGKVMHMLKATDPHFLGFGEVYFSWTNPKMIKAWKKHFEMTINYTVPVGRMRVVVYDDRKDSPTFKKIGVYEIGEDNYYLLTIPPNVWYGLQNISNGNTLVTNCATLPHDPKETVFISYLESDIAYTWA